nr:zinc finger, CCHC-type, retrotransposon Gag domain protein [Tanacetum cinerariifolium]
MVNTRADVELVAAVQNALQTLLPQIRAEIREEFRTGSGPSGSGGNPLPVTIHTWLERFNKQKPRSFEKATAPEHLKREYHSIRQTDTETSTEFMQRFLRLAGFLEAAAGTTEEQAKNFQWGLRKSTLNHLMCIPFRDKSGDRHQPTTQQSSHRNHGYNNDRHGSDRRGCGDNTAATTTTLAITTGVLVIGVTRETGVSSPTDLSILVSSSPGVPLRATPTRSALRVDADIQESVVV